MSYKNLEIWQLAKQLVIDIHKYLIYSISSNDETIDHLETLWDTKSLRNRGLFDDLHKRLNILGKLYELLTSYQWPATRNIITLTIFILWKLDSKFKIFI